jgi:ribosome-associated heat shock protein Hsp15
MSRSGGSDERDAETDAARRLDKWLWYARVVKSRTLAAGLVAESRVRVNRIKAAKPSHEVKPGDVLTVVAGPRLRVLKVVAVGVRRGPPAEARKLYEDLTPAHQETPGEPPLEFGRPQGAGRPTKRDRRQIDRFTGED